MSPDSVHLTGKHSYVSKTHYVPMDIKDGIGYQVFSSVSVSSFKIQVS